MWNDGGSCLISKTITDEKSYIMFHNALRRHGSGVWVHEDDPNIKHSQYTGCTEKINAFSFFQKCWTDENDLVETVQYSMPDSNTRRSQSMSTDLFSLGDQPSS